MKISIDTREESADDIRALIRFLESLIQGNAHEKERSEQKPRQPDTTDGSGEGDFSVMEFLSQESSSQSPQTGSSQDTKKDGDDDGDVPPLIPY